VSDELITIIHGPDDVVGFLRGCEVPTTDAAQIVLGLALTDSGPPAHTVCGAAVRSGEAAARAIDVTQLVDLAEELVVSSLVIATVEPGPPRMPSRAEVGRFVTLRCGCADEGVVLLDWVVLAGRHWWSLREQIVHEAA